MKNTHKMNCIQIPLMFTYDEKGRVVRKKEEKCSPPLKVKKNKEFIEPLRIMLSKDFHSDRIF